jgi:hypothetical protein
MVYPESFVNRVKYVFWRLYTPLHPFFRDTLTQLGLLKHVGRQNFLLGKIAPHLTVEEFVSHLVSKGYGNHFVAWKDEGEIVSLRYVKDFKYQYHLRVFKDGEVRAHYEYTPECNPILHIKERNMEPRREEFLEILGGMIVASE